MKDDGLALRFDETLVPRDPKGQWTFGGGKPDDPPDPAAPPADGPTGTIAAATGVEAVGKLLDKAVESGDFSGGEDDEDKLGSWDALSPDAKEKVIQDFYEGWSDGYNEVDTSDIDRAYERDLREENEDLIAAAEKDTLAALAEYPAFDDPQPTLPEGDFKLRVSVDPESIEVGVDDGDGAKVDLEKLRTLSDKPLTPDQQAVFGKEWDKNYQDAFDTAFEARYDDSKWQEQESQLQTDAQNEAWDNMSDTEKYDKAVDMGVADDTTARAVSPGLPTKWVTGIAPDSDNPSSDDYQRTRALSHALTLLRANEILAERGSTIKWKANQTDMVWSEWKSSSSNPTSWALQLATTQELGGLDRLTPAQHDQAIHAAQLLGGIDTMRAYVRAQWETTQFVMSKAGEHTVDVYRGLMLAGDTLDGASKEWIDSSGQSLGGGSGSKGPTATSFTRLPGVSLKRASLQSTSGTREVANGWGGVGEKPPNAKRVVLRISAPRTSVFSLPVYGKNIKSEHETVLAGLTTPWHWDAWEDRAPTHNLVPIPSKGQKRAVTKPKETKEPVLDLLDPAGQPHWLSKTEPLLVIKQQQAKAARPAKPAKPAKRSGYEDVPRDPKGRWTFGGDKKSPTPPRLPHVTGILSAIHEADGGFTYHAVTGDQPKSGFAVSLHKDREQIINANEASVDALAAYASTNWDLLSQADNYMGAWHNPNDHRVYLDVSTVLSSAAEAETKGRDAAQLAYFDLAHGQSVDIAPGHPTKLETNRHDEAHAQSHRTPDGPTDARRFDRTGQAADGPRADDSRDRQSEADSRPPHAVADTLRAARAFLARHADLRFNESLVPRDPKGQWTSGGGTPKAGDKPTAPKGKKSSGSLDPVAATLYSPSDALHSLLNGERVNIAREDVRAFLKKAGKQSEDPDLTDVHVEGMQIFGGNGLGIARKDMPQIPKELREEFLKGVRAQGVPVQLERVSPLTLAPTQREISARLVADKMRKYEKDPTRPFPPILIAQDGHVLDGHHHWGLMASVAVDNPKVKMPVYRLMTTTAKGLAMMHAFDKKHHIVGKATGRAIDDEGELRFDEALVPRDPKGRWTFGGGHASPSEVIARPSSHYTPVAENAIRPGQPQADTAQQYVVAAPEGQRPTYTAARQELHESIIAKHLEGVVPNQAQPIAVVFGGGPASGKSSLPVTLPAGAAHIDPDKLRSDLPEYTERVAAKDPTASSFTHEEATQLSKDLITRAKAMGAHVVLDGTGDSNIEKLTDKVNAMRAGGAKVIAHYVTAPTDVAWARAQKRAAENGRHVPEAIVRGTHRSVSNVLPQAVARGLFDEMTLWDTTIDFTPRIVATSKGTKLTIHDQALWDAFIKKGSEGPALSGRPKK